MTDILFQYFSDFSQVRQYKTSTTSSEIWIIVYFNKKSSQSNKVSIRIKYNELICNNTDNTTNHAYNNPWHINCKIWVPTIHINKNNSITNLHDKNEQTVDMLITRLNSTQISNLGQCNRTQIISFSIKKRFIKSYVIIIAT